MAVNYDIPVESEIYMTVRGLEGGRAGGSSGMRVEYLKGWHQEANHNKYPEGRRWEPVVRLVQVIFRDETVPEEIAWVTVVILLKKGGSTGVLV